MQRVATYLLLLCSHVIAVMADDGGIASERPRLELQSGHSSIVTALSLSENSRFLISAGQDDTLILWDASTGNSIRRFRGHNQPAGNIAFVRDKEEALSLDSEGMMLLWNLSEENAIKRVQLPGDSNYGSFTSAAIAPNGSAGIILGRDCCSGIELLKFDSHTGRTEPFESRDPSNSSPPNAGYITGLAMSPDGTVVVTANLDHSVSRWDFASGKITQTAANVPGIRAPVRRISILPDDKHALVGTGYVGDPFYMWDMEKNAFRELPTTSNLGHQIAIDPTGAVALMYESDRGGSIWDIESEKVVGNIPNSFVVTAALLPSRDVAYLGQWDGTISKIRISDGVELLRFTSTALEIQTADLSPDEKTIAVSSYPESKAKLISLAGSPVLREIGKSDGPNITAVKFCQSGDCLLTGTTDGSVGIWDWPNGKWKGVFKPPEGGYVESIAVSSNDRFAISGDANGRLYVWSPRNGQFMHKLSDAYPQSHYSHHRALALSADDRVLAASSKPGELKVWRTADWKLVHSEHVTDEKIGGSDDAIYSIAFSRAPFFDFAFGTAEGKIKIEGSGHWNQLARINIGESLDSLTFANQSRSLTAGTFQGSVFTLNQQNNYLRSDELVGHSGGVIFAKFSKDNRLLFTGSYDGSIRIWRLSSSGNGSSENITIAVFPRGDWIAVTSEGRFDTNNLDRIPGIRWLFPDDPFDALAPEVFIRDYYEPQLISRWLSSSCSDQMCN